MIKINNINVKGQDDNLLSINELTADDEGYDPELINVNQTSVENINGNDMLVLNIDFVWSCLDDIEFDFDNYTIKFTSDLSYNVTSRDILNINKTNQNEVEFSTNYNDYYMINDVDFFDGSNFKPNNLIIYNQYNEFVTDENIIQDITERIISNRSKILHAILERDKNSKPYINLKYLGYGSWIKNS